MKNLRYLGLLGFLGLLGLVTGNAGFYGFFGFFGFLGLIGLKNDELLDKNVGKAGCTAFVISTIGLSLSMTMVAFTERLELLPLAIAIVFALQVITFVMSFYLYDNWGE